MEDVSLMILDLVQNSIAANADTIRINVEEDKCFKKLIVEIDDNGKGMEESVLIRAADPFFTTRTTRKVGLGLSMAKAIAENSGGSFEINSFLGKGTSIRMIFDTSHFDCPPLGRIHDTLSALIATNTDLEFVYVHKTGDGVFEFNTNFVKSIIDGISIGTFEVVDWIRDYVKTGIDEINGGKYSEIA